MLAVILILFSIVRQGDRIDALSIIGHVNVFFREYAGKFGVMTARFQLCFYDI